MSCLGWSPGKCTSLEGSTIDSLGGYKFPSSLAPEVCISLCFPDLPLEIKPHRLLRSGLTAPLFGTPQHPPAYITSPPPCQRFLHLPNKLIALSSLLQGQHLGDPDQDNTHTAEKRLGQGVPSPPAQQCLQLHDELLHPFVLRGHPGALSRLA